MADTRVLIASGRADLACSNCATTQTHEIRVYYNATTGKLDVDKECVCYSDDSPGVRYREEYAATLMAK